VGHGTSVDGTNIRFLGNDLALSASIPGEPSQVSLSDCVFDGNESVIDIDGDVAVSLSSCMMQGGTGSDGDISIAGGAALDMRDSELRRTAGRAIVFENTASMVLINNVIETAYDYAISMFSSECGRFNRSSDLPEGTISGYGNTIQGGICPITLLFLGDPQPDELRLAPGQSVQAAIDRIVDGGVITLRGGTYRGNLDIEKPLTLVGLGDVTLVPDNQENPVIRITGETDVVIQDIRIEDAAIGLEVTQANCHILGCRIDGADKAINVIAFGGDVVRIEDCTLTGERFGVGVLTVGNGTIEIEECEFSSLGTGVVLGGLTSVFITASTFEDCFDGINLASSVAATLIGNHLVDCGIRVSPAPDDSQDGPLVISANTIQNSVGWGISLCGSPDSDTLGFAGQLSGTGNVMDGGYDSLCPADYDWPEGFIADDKGGD